MTPARAPLHDRRLLLAGEKRDAVLTLGEVEHYGRDSFGDPDYVQIYGLRPAQWYARGVRILGRTAVECTRDPLAQSIARDIAAVARHAGCGAGAFVLDPFAGSANTLFWVARTLDAPAIGFELDDAVYELSLANLRIVGGDITLVHGDYEQALPELRVAPEQLLVAFVAPPWGAALDATAGLDLRRTSPPVTAAVELIAKAFSGRRLLVAIQTYESTDPASLGDLRGRFEWSDAKIYDLDPPGRNHGLVLGTVGWAPPRLVGS